MVLLNRSKELFDSINSFTAGGVHSNYRTFLEHPLFFDKGRGSKLFDVDGNKYLELQKFLFNEKMLFTPFVLFHHGVTYSHTDDDLSNLLKAIETSVKKIVD